MKWNLVLVPLAVVAGMLIGSWGPRAELREREKLAAEEKARPRTAADGFSAFAHMVNIPEEARRSRRGREVKRVKRPGPAATNGVAKAGAPAEAVVPVSLSTNEVVSAPAENAKPVPPSRPEDLRARIAEAQELWRTRVEVARAQWKEKLKLDEAGGQKFDAVLDEMNQQLYDTMQALADQIASKNALTQELGLRMVGDATTIMAETYDKLGTVVPAEARGTVSEIQMTDFIDPGVAEPLTAVQGQLEKFRFPHGGRRRP